MGLQVGGVQVIDDSRNVVAGTTSVKGDRVAAATKLTAPFGTTAQRPVTPATGEMFFDTDEGTLVVWNGTDWV